MIQAILYLPRHPEQAFRSCLGILRLSKQYAHSQTGDRLPDGLADKELNYQAVKAVLELLPPLSPLKTLLFPLTRTSVAIPITSEDL